MSNSSIWPRVVAPDRVLSMGQSGPGSDGSEGVFHILQSSSITGTSSLDCLVSYQGHSLRKSYLSIEMQLVSSAAPANWADNRYNNSKWEWTWEWWRWRGTPHSPKLQHYWNLTIRLFSVISRTLIEEGGVLLLCRDAVNVFCSPPHLLGQSSKMNKFPILYIVLL